MKQEPSIQNSTQTLYSVIPLALDYTKSNYHQKYIDTPSSDCVLLSKDELPCTKLKYRNKTTTLLQDKRQKGKAGKFTLPFTFLLAGPSYTCQSLMKNYLTWPVLHSNSFSSSSIHLSKTKRKPARTRDFAMWKRLTFPKVWALATLSHVEVSCMQGIELQKELRRIFSYPITVHGIAPTDSETHSELLSWIFAIYALSTARKIFRTVLCHYSSLEAQQQVWNKNNLGTHSPWDMLYDKSAVPRNPLCSITNSATRTTPASTPHLTETTVKEASQYKEKKYVYSLLQKRLQKRYIGFSSKHHRFRYLVKGHVRKQKKQILTLHYNSTHVSLQLPLLPDTQTLQDIKNVLASIFDMDKDKIMIHHLQSSLNPMDLYLDNRTVITNLVLKAAEKLQKKRKQNPNKEQELVYVLNTNQIQSISLPYSIAATIELDVTQYSQKILLRKIHLALQLDPLFHTQRIAAILENELHKSLFSLLGSDCLPLKHRNEYFEIHLLAEPQVKPGGAQHHYLYPPDQLHFVIHNALLDAFEIRKNKPISFPIQEAGALS